MKLNPVNKLLIALLLSVLALAPFTNYAQGGNTPLQMGKVSQLSDQQIMQIWQQTQKAGISESDAIKLLVKKGMDPSEVNNFKRRLVQLQGSNKSKFGTNMIKDTTDFIKDSSWVFEVPQLKKKSNYYGYEFFSNPNNNFEPNLRIATPKNYVLGPDDEIIINITGLNESTVDAKISPEGTVQLPYAGIISLNGLTIEQASQKIKNKMKQAYPALASGRTQLFVTLSNMKSIRIKVVGEAEHPG
ncbi:MAG: polysaccharide biosynthesis/export family protein, partial [Bacteroidota bacterium]